jgi:hypothetical protein
MHQLTKFHDTVIYKLDKVIIHFLSIVSEKNIKNKTIKFVKL